MMFQGQRTLLFVFCLHLLHLAYHAANAQTAVLFGSNGMVGSEIYQSLMRQKKESVNDRSSPFWKQIILIGRRWKQEQIIEESKIAEKSKPIVTRIQISDLNEITTNKKLQKIKADVCIIAVGMGKPHESNLHDWHHLEVEITATIASVCKKMKVSTISLLSSADSQMDALPFSEEEVMNKNDPALGWWGFLVHYFRMKGLAEQAVASSDISSVRIFQPSNIVTETIRYGWVDWTIFKISPFLDAILPAFYHSVPVKLLGMAFARDAMSMIDLKSHEKGVTALTYNDFIKIAGEQYDALQKSQEL